jgi:hypothetical protein
VSLRDVIDQILQPFGLSDHRVARFSVEGDEVRLQPKAALTLAMLFHELADQCMPRRLSSLVEYVTTKPVGQDTR